MDAQGLPIVSPKIDYRNVERISPQRLLCFLNHFYAHTVAFLNAFATTCERRLENVNRRLQRTEATLSVLEAKLSSIPGLDHVQIPNSSSTASTSDATFDHASLSTTHSNNVAAADMMDVNSTTSAITNHDSHTVVVDATCSSSSTTVDDDAPKTNFVMAKNHPAYAKYFRMLHMGVPLQAAVHKCRSESPHLDVLVLNAPEMMMTLCETTTMEDKEGKSDEDDDEGWSR